MHGSALVRVGEGCDPLAGPMCDALLSATDMDMNTPTRPAP